MSRTFPSPLMLQNELVLAAEKHIAKGVISAFIISVKLIIHDQAKQMH